MRALRVREVLDGGEIDIDEVTNVHSLSTAPKSISSLIVWCGESEDGNELVVDGTVYHSVRDIIGCA